MKRIISTLGILFVALFVAGCASPRYDVRVAPVGGGGWVAVRIDRQTGQCWYSSLPVGPNYPKPEWYPLKGGVESQQK
ncbi:MAG: hypothetical protein KGJ88_12950 [Verrucomicrobiota bacterium]|nr:hypothetical protein [Verrucomicrobiota bacterium]